MACVGERVIPSIGLLFYITNKNTLFRMIGVKHEWGLMKTTSRLAVAAAAGLFMGGVAHAGGAIGGDCCADLEERVAELEATTARKGNRKVSLTVYGQVNKAIVISDESITDDLQIVDNALSQSRFGLQGKARISSDLYAGYRIEFGVGHNEADGSNQGFEYESGTINLRHNDLYIGSKTFGKVSLGHGSTASDGIAEIDLSGTTVAGSSDNLAEFRFNNLDGFSRQERIRYDTPSLAGFKVSASWQDNENWDVALRFGQSFGDFTVAAGVAYYEEDATGLDGVSGSASVFHNPTGLNLTFAAGDSEIDATEYWYVKAGIKRKYFAAGSTAFSVDYHDSEVAGIENEKFGFQLVQNIDAAATELYVSGWFAEDELGYEEDAVMAGARIKF